MDRHRSLSHRDPPSSFWYGTQENNFSIGEFSLESMDNSSHRNWSLLSLGIKCITKKALTVAIFLKYTALFIWKVFPFQALMSHLKHDKSLNTIHVQQQTYFRLPLQTSK